LFPETKIALHKTTAYAMDRIKNMLINATFNMALLFISNATFAQTVFFKSTIAFSAEQLSTFHSSFIIDSTQIYFAANDYKIYAVNKKSGKTVWSYYMSYKTSNTPKVYKTSVFVENHMSEYENKCTQLDIRTGDTVQTLKIKELYTEPIFKNDTMYCSAISPEFGGAILAYDLKKNDIVWYQFIAHGVAKQPYFFKDKIIANAEDNNWFEIDYNGKLLDTSCKNKAYLFVEDIHCVKQFKYLTHNQNIIPESYFEEEENIVIKYSDDKTFVLSDSKILIINNKNKIEKQIQLDEVLTITEGQVGSYKEILKVEGNRIWFLYKNILAVYDFKNSKTLQTFDLTKWNVHQAILDNNNLWLISKKDGQLVGLVLK
jgi:PQQ-like domain